MKRLLRALALVGLLVAIGATGQTSQQLLTYQDVVDNVNAGNFRWVGSALTGSSQVITSSAFAAAVTNNGACPNGGSATTYLPTFSDMLSCRTLAAGVTQHTTALNGFALNASTCNLACSSGGGSAQPADPLNISVTVGQVDATHPVVVTPGSMTTPSTTTNFTWQITDGGGTVRGSGSGTAPTTVGATSITVGTSGTWTYTLKDTALSRADGTQVEVDAASASATSYY